MSKSIKETAIELARLGGERMRSALEKHSELKIHSKGTDDLVTEVDLWIEKQIVERVTADFPSHSIVGEEGIFAEDSSSAEISKLFQDEYCWVIDPVDGTSNFANGFPHCCVSIGILYKGELHLGVVYDPFRDELFFAEKGKGAFLNDKKISISKKENCSDLIVGMSLPSDVKENWDLYKIIYKSAVLNFHKVRLLGSTALELCWTASGRLDGFVSRYAKSWDLAAGALIVEEAGGHARNFNNQDTIDLLGESIIAASPELLPKILAQLELK